MNHNLLSVGTCFNNGCLFSTATRYQLYVHSQLFSDTARICFTNELETIKYKRITCIVPKSFLHLFFSSIIGYSVLYKYILLVRVTCEKYRLRGEANIPSRFNSAEYLTASKTVACKQVQNFRPPRSFDFQLWLKINLRKQEKSFQRSDQCINSGTNSKIK
jgi:hypothetical protein